jgi:Zn-dependent protease
LQIYTRAKSIFFKLPWPDNTFFILGSVLGDSSPSGSSERRACFRLILATIFTVFHGISAKFRMTYPDPFVSMRKLGLLTAKEIEEMERKFERFPYLSEIR